MSPHSDQERETLKEGIEKALAMVRSYLQEDEGDIELVSVSPEGIVEVRFLGECATCSMALMTLRAGVEKAIMLEVPAIRRIEMV